MNPITRFFHYCSDESNLFNRNLLSQYPFSQYRPPKPLSRAAAATKPSMPPFQAA